MLYLESGFNPLAPTLGGKKREIGGHPQSPGRKYPALPKQESGQASLHPCHPSKVHGVPNPQSEPISGIALRPIAPERTVPHPQS
jgi:hypothetical protein